MKILIFSILAPLIFLIQTSFAGAGYTGPEFIPVDGKMCVYKESTENVKVVYTKEDCLEGSDPATFQKFRKGGLLFGKGGKHVYVDKNALYYFPINSEWIRTELHIKGLKRLKEQYLTDGENYYYNGLPNGNIVNFGQVRNGKITYLGDGLISYSGGLYYRGILQMGINPEKIEKKNGYFFSGTTLLMPDGWMLHKVENVDTKTFKKEGNNYEDKNNYYNLVFGHYGFSIETNQKIQIYKNTEYGFQFYYPGTWKIETVRSFNTLSYTPKLRLHLSNEHDFPLRKFEIMIDIVSKEEYKIPTGIVFNEQGLEIPQNGSKTPTYIKVTAKSIMGGNPFKGQEKQAEIDTTLFEKQWKNIIGSFQSLP